MFARQSTTPNACCPGSRGDPETCFDLSPYADGDPVCCPAAPLRSVRRAPFSIKWARASSPVTVKAGASTTCVRKTPGLVPRRRFQFPRQVAPLKKEPAAAGSGAGSIVRAAAGPDLNLGGGLMICGVNDPKRHRFPKRALHNSWHRGLQCRICGPMLLCATLGSLKLTVRLRTIRDSIDSSAKAWTAKAPE